MIGALTLRIKIEDRLPSGERISITIEGSDVSKQKVLQVLEMLRLISGKVNSDYDYESLRDSQAQLKDIIWDAILMHFGNGNWFTSRDLQVVLKRYYGIDVKLSSLATYLLRFYQNGYLDRRGSRAGRIYKVRLSSSQSTI